MASTPQGPGCLCLPWAATPVSLWVWFGLLSFETGSLSWVVVKLPLILPLWRQRALNSEFNISLVYRAPQERNPVVKN